MTHWTSHNNRTWTNGNGARICQHIVGGYYTLIRSGRFIGNFPTLLKAQEHVDQD